MLAIVIADILIAILFVDVQLIASCLIRRLPSTSKASRTALQVMIPAMDVTMVAFTG
jgi:hypothetical protein